MISLPFTKSEVCVKIVKMLKIVKAIQTWPLFTHNVMHMVGILGPKGKELTRL